MQTGLFDKAKDERPSLPAIYIYENLNINRKINYKSAPCNLYGTCKDLIMGSIYNQINEYGLTRGYLDYSLEPNEDLRK